MSLIELLHFAKCRKKKVVPYQLAFRKHHKYRYSKTKKEPILGSSMINNNAKLWS
jgi:hypothetical protein